MNDNCYKFDLDANGILALTEDNVTRINFIIENDSNYRIYNDKNNSSSVYNFIKQNKNKLPWEIDDIETIVTEIDKQNSTHQDSLGVKKDAGNPTAKNNGGRRKTAEYIYNISNLYERLEIGDASLVDEIAKALYKSDGGGRYTFSFASKFCTFVSNALYDNDKYSIYDKVLNDVLPYYAWAYLGKDCYFGRTKSKIGKVFGVEEKNGNYKDYRQLIDDIINRNKELTGYLISRRDFDHLLWYYFKGDRDIKSKENNEYLHTSRTTIALKNVGNKNTVLK